MMETHPDSALTLLEPYDGAEIRSEAQRARYALLYSMALDKNYIDKTDFEVLQPALDYYPTHGTDADKLRTLYYAGVIHENADSMASAMQAWAEALQYQGPETDSLTLAHLLVAQGNEYYRLYQFQRFIKNQCKAEEIYSAIGKKDFADKAFLNQFELSLHRDSSYAKENRGRVEIIALDTISPNAELARSKALQYEMHFGSLQSLDSILDAYKGLPIDSLDLTQALFSLGRIQAAENVLLATQPDDDFKIKYLLRKLRIAKAKGNFEEALANSEKVLEIFDKKQSSIIEGDIQFAEERSEWSRKVENQERATEKVWILSSISLLIVLLISIILYLKLINARTKKALLDKETHLLKIEYEKRQLEIERVNKDLRESERNLMATERNLEETKRSLKDTEKSLEETERSLFEVKDKKETLEAILDNKNRVDAIPATTLANRLSALNALFPLCLNHGREEQLKEILSSLLADKSKFLRDTRLVYTASHPDFIAFFEEKELTEDEIEYLCLYAIGFSGKEAGAYIGRRAFYNLSGRVRKKLGIKSESLHLSRFIRNLLNGTNS